MIQNGIERKNLDEVELLIAIPSSAEHFEQRRWIRETWGQKEPSLFKKKAIYFFLGRSANQTINEAVRKENQRFKDIVQAGESYFFHHCFISKINRKVAVWIHPWQVIW